MNTVYLLSDPVTRAPRYVGVTNNFGRRMKEHLYGLSGAHCKNWIKKLSIDGLTPFSEILEEVDDDDRRDSEIFWILAFRITGANLVNLTTGGDGGSGFTLSYDHKHKISIARIGHVVSAETREKISISEKNRVFTQEHRRKLSVARKGKLDSAKTREKKKLSLKKYWEQQKAA
jgi:group I intron endonuclease